MRIGLIQVFAVMLLSGRFAASSPPRGEPDIVHELTTQDTRSGLSERPPPVCGSYLSHLTLMPNGMHA